MMCQLPIGQDVGELSSVKRCVLRLPSVTHPLVMCFLDDDVSLIDWLDIDELSQSDWLDPDNVSLFEWLDIDYVSQSDWLDFDEEAIQTLVQHADFVDDVAQCDWPIKVDFWLLTNYHLATSEKSQKTVNLCFDVLSSSWFS